MEVHDIHREWGRRIRDRRLALGLTQTQLADILGVHQPALSYWEKGVSAPRDDHKVKLAGALATTVHDLFAFPAVRPPFPQKAA